MQSWVVIGASALYLAVLFSIAWWGERLSRNGPLFERGSMLGAAVYALSLAIHNTAWSYYGTVGRAAESGFAYIAPFLGTAFLLIFGQGFVRRVIAVSKAQNITSIADFIAARYGKSRSIAAFVTIASFIGILPYIALQLKAVAVSFDVLTGKPGGPAGALRFFEDTSFWAAFIAAVFTIFFGVRHIHASERHRGFILALAFESLVKIGALAAVTLYSVYGTFSGFGDLIARASDHSEVSRLLALDFLDPAWYSLIAVSFLAFLCLPQCFHVAVIENDDSSNIGRAAWLYPAYALVFAAFVMPLALAGVLTFAGGINPDTFTIALPVAAGAPALALLTFIGGLSAATGMLIVSTVALSTMLCNDVLMPYFLRIADKTGGISTLLLVVRRCLVFLILFIALLLRWLIDESVPLTQLGLMSVVAIAQFSPAFFGGFIWKRASPDGALAGMAAGLAVWTYTLLIPAMAPAFAISQTFLHDGPWGISWLRPSHLFGLDSLDAVSNAALWSLALNLCLFVLLSLWRPASGAAREQALVFIGSSIGKEPARREFGPAATFADLAMIASRFAGADQAGAAFREYLRQRGREGGGALTLDQPADSGAWHFTETFIAGAIGAASARIVVASACGRKLPRGAANELIEDASAELLAKHRLLCAIMETVPQGICAADAGLCISAWNSRIVDILGLPPDFLKVGMPLSSLVAFKQRGEDTACLLELPLLDRGTAAVTWPCVYERTQPDGTVYEVTFNKMAGGGYVATCADVTARHNAAQALRAANELLEQRVQKRTLELEHAKAEAEEANARKTRFLAGTSHDLLQPLSAARLFLETLQARLHEEAGANDGISDAHRLVSGAKRALDSADQLLEGLLDISSLESGAVQLCIRDFAIADLLAQLESEFAALAARKRLALRMIASTAIVRTDPVLLNRILRNLLSNAIRYTASGRVLLGCRRGEGKLQIQVWDTGPGIPADSQRRIFEEFCRLPQNQPDGERGLGLGLAVVEGIANLLDMRVTVRSTPGRGSMFAVEAPMSRHPSIAAGEPSSLGPFPAAPRQLLILCIDDHGGVLEGLKRQLEAWGHCVTAANDASAVVANPGENVPDVVLVDYHLGLPVTGLEVLASLRRCWDASVPAALITADRSEAVRRLAGNAACAILYKPVRPAALRSYLNSVSSP
ncbi:MAG: PAS-domain containing protein [Beijerinckiaceae bacterium]|nr:PAS-domain containing protein [Beijerinckiaceae bacterium]